MKSLLRVSNVSFLRLVTGGDYWYLLASKQPASIGKIWVFFQEVLGIVCI